MLSAFLTQSPQFPANVSRVRKHYDRLSFLYRAFWGEHLHHGYWNGNESVSQAQLQLMEELSRSAAMPRGAAVLDIGCGVGGSALWLVQQFDCRVTGMTISPDERPDTPNVTQKQVGGDRQRRKNRDRRIFSIILKAVFLQPELVWTVLSWMGQPVCAGSERRALLDAAARARLPVCKSLLAQHASSTGRIGCRFRNQARLNTVI